MHLDPGSAFFTRFCFPVGFLMDTECLICERAKTPAWKQRVVDRLLVAGSFKVALTLSVCQNEFGPFFI